jgi:aromatic ring-opening dioxygenase LigB subunit
MSPKTIAVFTSPSDNYDKKKLDTIYSFFKDQYDDFVVISDETTDIENKYAVIPSIYLKFFKGDVVFASVTSYLKNNTILANTIYVDTTTDELISQHIPKNRLKNINVLSLQDSKIEVINYGQIL